ncbi:MAG: arylsulfatase [Planctomycetales bacterium]|nr:arylsulfatase [Planctomycetales bacterium]
MNRTLPRKATLACGWERAFMAHFLALACAWGALHCGAAVAAADSRPNIVIVLVDDMGFSDVGCYGGEIETPNIDRLAAEGLRFTQFYNSGRCCPTRASLMTGLHPHQAGIGHMTEPPERPLGFDGPYQGHLNDQCTTLAEVLRAAGYHTLMTGKWHLGYHQQEDWPLQRGFDRYFGIISGAANYFKPGGDRGLTEGNDACEPPEGFYATDDFTTRACDYIDEALQQDDRPFFLYLAYNAPHWPLNSKWEEYKKYRGKYRDGWEALMQRRFARQKELGLFGDDVQPASHQGPKWDSLNAQQRDDLDAIMAAYAGCIDSIDQNIGKLNEFLESRGVRDNTVVFFLSDNGACQEGGRLGHGNEAMVKDPPLETTNGVHLGQAWANACNTPFRLYKHFLHEGGACTPLIVNWPAGIPQIAHGKISRQLGYLPDFMPTCLELASAEYPTGKTKHQGESLVPLLRGVDEPIHRAPVFWEHEGNAAMRDGNWKLVRRYEQPWELYDLNANRTEIKRRASSDELRKQEMIAAWSEWATRLGVAFPQRFDMYQHLQRLRQQEKASAE